MDELIAFRNNLTEFFTLLLDDAAKLYSPGTPPPKNALLVHSSLSSFGGADADTVLLALLDASGSRNLTLMMPSHSDGRTDDPVLPVLYERKKTPCFRMGKIPELFRTMPGVFRSAHPLLSFCAKGPLAGKLMRGHRAETALGKASPLGKLYGMDGLILMLGTGYDSCTALHLAEYETARVRDKKGEAADRVTCAAGLIRFGRVYLKTWTDIAYHGEHFADTGEAFERKCPDGVALGDIPRMDGAPARKYRLMRVRGLLDFSIDRYGLLE